MKNTVGLLVMMVGVNTKQNKTHYMQNNDGNDAVRSVSKMKKDLGRITVNPLQK